MTEVSTTPITILPKLNIICPNCGSPNYMTDISSVSKEYKIKCTNCNKYFKDYDEVIKLHKEKLDETPDSQKAKGDSGKPKLSLVPRRIIFDIARVREYGNNKYPDGGIDNWKQIEPERYRDAAFRHFLAYLDDPYGLDAESGLPHLWHLACNVSFLCDLEDSEILSMTRERQIGEVAHGDAIGHKVCENADGSVTFKLSKEGQDVIDKLSDCKLNMSIPSMKDIEGIKKRHSDEGLNKIDILSWMKKYKDLHVKHMDAEPGWTRWEKAWREHDGEAEYYRRGILEDKIQFGDYDFESGEIIPRKE